ncbi:Ycf66-like protein [Halomicronema hongdechloris C2206]|uniref:Ycf66-like protein n=1 Tax=Halomicronema hongdechloris C2206 TaxID=1641165 RepID=A0A1Z3HMX4_9CYAN|nr:Ycf66 family protein [Halomicronema hongdechloris]ASC71641.1 Ycf66-like protein [Halomicronema hongdechloris C2206]
MVNIGFSFASLMGIVLAVSGAGLYFLRSFRPNLARDHDVFFAAVALGAGGILFFNGWRLDPILQFGQLLMVGSAIFFAVESIRMRGLATEQAKRRTPVVDDERPVSRVYRAELDDWEQVNERVNTRRIRGSRDDMEDDYEEDYRRRPAPSSRSSVSRLNPSSDRIRRRRPRPDGRISDARSESMGNDVPPSRWDDEPPSRRPRRPDGPRPSRSEDVYGRSEDAYGRPPKAGRTYRPERSGDGASDYVDYRPVDYSDEDIDRPADYGY